jgi:hypothetical protein
MYSARNRNALRLSHINECVTQNTPYKNAEETLLARGYNKSLEQLGGMSVKETIYDETTTRVVEGVKCVRFVMKSGGPVVEKLSIVVLVLNGSDEISEVFTWDEYIGP